MALKVRKGCVIALIVIAIIFAGFLSLKFFFKKSLEAELNKVFNAQVKIGKLDLKLFSGQIQIKDILIIGKGEFENDTLISCEELLLDLEDFDRKTNTVVFGNVLLDNLTIKNIISENENLCWENIINKKFIEENSLYKDDEDFKKMSVKFRQIVLTDGIIEVIDRKNNKEQKLSDMHLKLELNSDVKDIEANFNFECLYSTELHNELKCRVNGDFVSFKDDLSANAKICLNEFPFSCKFFMNTDSLENSKITINANSDLSKINAKTNNYKGEILFELDALLLQNMSIANLDYCLLADSLVVKNKNTLDSIFINFEYDVKLNNIESFANTSALTNLNVCSAKENLTGDFFMELSDTNYCLSSSLNGEFSYKNFAKILELENKNFDFNLVAKSDLKYEYNLHKNSKQGDFLISSNFTSPVFEMTNAKIEFKNNEFVLNSDFSSKYSKGDFVINFGDFTNYIKQKPILFASQFNFSKLIIPKFEIDDKKLPSKTIPSFSSENFKPYISDKLKLSTTCKIDTLNIFEKDIYNIETNFVIDSENFVFKSNKIILEEGYLKFNFEKLKKDEDKLFITELDLNNFALNYFLDEKDTSISGWLTANIHNTIYLDEEKSAKSYGENKIGLKQFQKQSDIFGEYGIADEKYLKISDFEAKIILKNDSLNLLPFKVALNDLNADLVGFVDLSSKKMDFNILLDIPDHYYTNLVKVALYAISTKGEVKLPKKQNRIFRLLKIEGDLEKPKFVLYE